MKSTLPTLMFFVLLFAVTQVAANDKDAILSQVRQGNFTQARTMINRFMIENPSRHQGQTALDRLDLEFQKERMNRIEYDFRAKEETVLDYIRRYYPDMTPDEFSQQISQWKKSKAIEVMFIDSKERYFRAAGTNLFLIDKQAREQRTSVDGPRPSVSGKFYHSQIPIIRKDAQESKSPTGLAPHTFTITYTLRVPADTIPAGEVLRCWLPYPHRDTRRQSEIEFLDSNLSDSVISPKDFEHSTIYAEKVAIEGEDTVFQVKFRYKSTAESFDLKAAKIKPYDKDSELYKKYTAERKTHIIFTPEIRALSKEIVGEETDPVIIATKIYDWIHQNIPWASAREYSTVENIPMYSLENKHGDCGMQTLLLITLCRYNGIPAKWQSGFMLVPDGSNLHDWGEIYFEGVGWVPVDQSYSRIRTVENDEPFRFFLGGIDTYRFIVNEDYSRRLYPEKIFPRSETVDFQRGEVEWKGGNLYFNQWKWNLAVEY